MIQWNYVQSYDPVEKGRQPKYTLYLLIKYLPEALPISAWYLELCKFSQANVVHN